MNKIQGLSTIVGTILGAGANAVGALHTLEIMNHKNWLFGIEFIIFGASVGAGIGYGFGTLVSKLYNNHFPTDIRLINDADNQINEEEIVVQAENEIVENNQQAALMHV